MGYCTDCGNKLEDVFLFCPECGKSISEEVEEISNLYGEVGEKIRCEKCGEYMPSDSIYCLFCGNLFDKKDESISEICRKIQSQSGVWKNKYCSLILCFFFGWLGIHKFYEGRPIRGLIYMFTLGVFGIGWFIDIVILAFKPNPYRVK